MTNRQVKVMRGISGSGKSTFAKKLATFANEQKELPVIVSADNFFIGADGVYRFNVETLGEAHKACMREFIQCIRDTMSPIIVDNTNINIEDAAPYVAVGEALGYEVEILQVNTPLEVASGRNVHGVPARSVEGMFRRMMQIKLPSRFKVTHING